MERSRLSIRALVVLASRWARSIFWRARPVYDDGSRGDPGGV